MMKPVMTSLMNSTSMRLRQPAGGRRPLVISGIIAGVAASASVLVGCMAVALAGWFAADEGTHGATTDALRIGSAVWLVAHRAGIEIDGAPLTLTPLLLTILCAHVAYRMGRWAGLTSEPGDTRTVGVAAACLASAYALVAMVVAMVVAAGGPAPDAVPVFVGGFVIALIGGGLGLAIGAELELPELVTPAARSIVLGGVLGALLMFIAGAALVAVRLFGNLDEAANVLSALNVDNAGAAFATLAAAGLIPNAAMYAVAYLVGPGFAVGSGTAVTTGAVTLGPLPASPILVALPDPGPGPASAPFLLATPVLVGVVVGWWITRAFPCSGYLSAVARAVGAGVVAGALLGLGCLLASGALGDGRLATIGPQAGEVAVAAAVAIGMGAAAGAAARSWRQHRRGGPEAPEALADADEDTVAVDR